MKFDIISLFPEFFNSPLSCGILRIAQQKGAVEIKITNPRDFTTDGVTDDYQFGGGPGMVLKPEPLTRAINYVKREDSLIINLSPQGRLLHQRLVQELKGHDHIILVCGRYKGIDERINQLFNPLEISIGDYVLAGGEIASLAIMESIIRLLPNVLGNRDSAETDSLNRGLLEAPIYTRPSIFGKIAVPPVLRSGNHRRISDWRLKESLKKTIQKKPALLPEGRFTKNDLSCLLEVLDEENS